MNELQELDDLLAFAVSWHISGREEASYYEEVDPDKAIQIQWYPVTPIGFYLVCGATLVEAVENLKAFLLEEEK